MRIIVTGPKGIGKSTLGKKTASYLGIPFYDMDDEVKRFLPIPEGTYAKEEHELAVFKSLIIRESYLISTGWRTFINSRFNEIKIQGALIVLVKGDRKLLHSRLSLTKKRDFFDEFNDAHYIESADKIYEKVEPMAHLIIEADPFKKSGFHRSLGEMIRSAYSDFCINPQLPESEDRK